MYLRDPVAAAKQIGSYDVVPGGVVMCTLHGGKKQEE